MGEKISDVVKYIFLFYALIGLMGVLPARCENEKYPKYYLSLSYSSGKIAVGDLNTCLTSLNNNDLFEYVRSYSPWWGKVDGGLQTLPGRYQTVELSFYMAIKPRLSINISVFEPFQKKNHSSVQFTLFPGEGQQVMIYEFQPRYSMISPLEFTIFYKLIRLREFSFSVGAGSGLYIARISRLYDFKVIYPNMWEEIFEMKLNTLHFPLPSLVGHLNFLAEYSLGKKLSIITELKIRGGKISNFFGNESTINKIIKEDNMEYVLGRWKEKGTLYFYNMEDQFIGERYYNMSVWSEIPYASPEYYREIRKGSLDLTGVSFKIGFMIRIF